MPLGRNVSKSGILPSTAGFTIQIGSNALRHRAAMTPFGVLERDMATGHGLRCPSKTQTDNARLRTKGEK
jgi:hypothetical protein